MADSLASKALRRQPAPHALAVACLEAMRPSIRRDADAVEASEEILEVDEGSPFVQHARDSRR